MEGFNTQKKNLDCEVCQNYGEIKYGFNYQRMFEYSFNDIPRCRYFLIFEYSFNEIVRCRYYLLLENIRVFVRDGDIILSESVRVFVQ